MGVGKILTIAAGSLCIAAGAAGFRDDGNTETISAARVCKTELAQGGTCSPEAQRQLAADNELNKDLAAVLMGTTLLALGIRRAKPTPAFGAKR